MEHNSYYKKGGDTQPKPKPKMGKKVKPKEPQIVRYYFEDEPFEYAKGGGVKADNNFLIDKAISSDQKEVLKDIVPILNKKGIQLRMGTYVGKSPQTIIIDKDREDGILSISGKGYNSEFLPTFDDEEFSDKEDFARIISEKFAKGGAIYKGNKVKIKETGKTMKVTDISKGKKGYVEFTGSQGTFLKGDIDKMAKGGTAKPKPKKGKKGKPKEPKIVRYYFEDEPFEYGKGGSPSFDKKHKIIVKGKPLTLTYSNSYINGYNSDGSASREYTFLDSNGMPYTGYGKSIKEALKSIEDYQNSLMAKGGAIYKGNKVKIKETGKTMKVTDISKGKKGYVEFTGSEGTFLKGDIDKMAKGGSTESCWCYEIGGF